MIRLLTIIFLFYSCNSSSKVMSEPTESTSTNQIDIDFEIIAQDNYGGKITSEFLVIKNIETLNAIYNQISFGKIPKMQTPTIDFEKEIVLALFLGEKTSGGYAITVNNVLDNDNQINIRYKITTPKKRMMTTSVMTQPYCIIKMTKTSKEIVFRKID